MSVSDPEKICDSVVALLSKHAHDPEISVRLAALERRRLLVVIFENSARLTWQEVRTSRGIEVARLPDFDAIRAERQRVFVYVVTIGAGEFNAEKVRLPQVPDGLPTVYMSVPVLCALLVGHTETPAGPAPYSGATAFQAGHLDATGLDLSEMLAYVGPLTETIARTRMSLGIGSPSAGNTAASLAPTGVPRESSRYFPPRTEVRGDRP